MEYEKKLIQKCKNGDVEAFEILIEDQQQRVFNIALRMLNNADDASDISQEVFIRVFNSIGKFKGESSLSTWIYRIATNMCLDEIRRRKRASTISLDSSIQLEDGEVSMQLKDESPGPHEMMEQRELQSEIKTAIQLLNEDHRAAIMLRDINGLSYDEISEILDCSLGTVKSRISRARKSLKNILLKSGKELFNNSSV